MLCPNEAFKETSVLGANTKPFDSFWRGCNKGHKRGKSIQHTSKHRIQVYRSKKW
jgi:hypothetical protein